MTRSLSSDPRTDPQWHLVRATAATRVAAPTGLVDRVLRSVHGVTSTRSEYLHLPSSNGSLRISHRVLVLLVRRVGAELGQAIGGVRISAVAMEADGLDVLISVRYGISAPRAAKILRQRLQKTLATYVEGLVPSINVHIVDVHQA